MDELKQKFLVLVRQLETLKAQQAKVLTELDDLMGIFEYGEYIQDPNDLVVYKIVKPKGKFVYYADVEYVRTAKPDEDRGTLSKEEAKKAGFIINK